MLNTPLPAISDLEDDALPQNLPPVIDAHVHLFPDELFAAVWQWFETYGWPIRYKLGSDAILSFLFDRGISHIIGLHYAHKPGVSSDLNRYMASLCARHDRLTGMATVYPGEPDAGNILIEGFNMGLKGVKLHAHVQCFDMQSQSMKAIYQVCSDHGRSLVIHAGR